MRKERVIAVFAHNTKVVTNHLQGILDGKYSHPVEQRSILEMCINYMNQNLSLHEKYMVEEEES